jgi:hypothetical protein
MQSVSKTGTSVIIGAAMQRGDFKVGLDTTYTVSANRRF